MIEKLDMEFYEKLIKIQKIKNVDYYKNPSNYYIEPFKIAGNLFYVGDKKVCSHLIDTGDGLILLDSGYQHTIHLLLQSIWELGYNPKNIKYIIHSHEHYDHIGAANEFKNLFKCKLVISESGARVFNFEPELVFLKANPYPYARLFIPDIFLKDGDVLELGNTSIKCIATPGHADGVMSFFFNIFEKNKVYKVGYFGGISNQSLSKEFLHNVGRSAKIQDIYLQSLEKVMYEKVDITLGNHPRQNNTIEKRLIMSLNCDSNPFIDPFEWQRMITTYKNEFEKLLGHESDDSLIGL